jgi:hypothetical protein
VNVGAGSGSGCGVIWRISGRREAGLYAIGAGVGALEVTASSGRILLSVFHAAAVRNLDEQQRRMFSRSMSRRTVGLMLRERSIERVVEKCRALDSLRVVAGDEGKGAADEAEPSRLGHVNPLRRVGVTNDHAHRAERRVVDTPVLDQRFERRAVAGVARWVRRAGRVKAGATKPMRFVCDLAGRNEHEDSVWIDEAADEPRRRRTIDLDPALGDPVHDTSMGVTWRAGVALSRHNNADQDSGAGRLVALDLGPDT